MNALSENRKYKLSLLGGNVKDCIYEGVCGNSHCFTTQKTKDEWEYYFLAEGDFRVNDSGIEVLANQPKIVPISREAEPMEFLQVQQAWNRIMES